MPYKEPWGEKARERSRKRSAYFRERSRKERLLFPDKVRKRKALWYFKTRGQRFSKRLLSGYDQEITIGSYLPGSKLIRASDYDLEWRGLKIEVKSSTEHKDGTYTYDVRSNQLSCDCLVFLCVGKDLGVVRFFVVNPKNLESYFINKVRKTISLNGVIKRIGKEYLSLSELPVAVESVILK